MPSQKEIKELVSSKELEALLGEEVIEKVDEPLEEVLPVYHSFEEVMQYLQEALDVYFKEIGLLYDELLLVKSVSNHFNSCQFCSDDEFVEAISLDNSLALNLIAKDLGSKEEGFVHERELTSLEQRLIAPIGTSIIEIVQKCVTPFFLADEGLEEVEDYSFLFLYKNQQSALRLSFVKDLFTSSSVIILEEESVSLNRFDAVVGMVEAETLKVGEKYAVELFAPMKRLLLLEGYMAFRAVLISDKKEKVYRIEEPLHTLKLAGLYYLVTATKQLDDASLLELNYGATVSFESMSKMELHKNGTMIGHVVLSQHEGVPVVELLKGS